MILRIREERAGDHAEISSLISAAFDDAPHSSGTEAIIVEGLRSASALAISLVAEWDGRLVGHAAFSPVTIAAEDCGWYGLGPIAVRPDVQRQGIGSALIEQGLAQLHFRSARGCVVLGEPEYYWRFGFRADPRLTFPGPPPEYFQALRFSDEQADGEVGYHAAFAA